MQLEQLQKDMIAAMKAKDKPRKDAISSLVSAGGYGKQGYPQGNENRQGAD